MEQYLQLYNYLAAVFSGIFFWIGFLLLGFIAKRYSKVFNKKTFYTLLLMAPSGILLYSILLILKTSLIIKDVKINEFIQIIAYIFFVFSAILCFIAVYKFNKVLNELIKYEGKK